jgi:cytosine/adenosine deaminase-related metal-dependent hydrolase
VQTGQQLLIQEGKVTQIGEQLKTYGLTIAERLDCSGKIVIPGLVNAHSHLLEILQRSFRDNVRKEVWIRQRQLPKRLRNYRTMTSARRPRWLAGRCLKAG